MPREAVAFLMFVTMVGGFVLLYPVVRALAERLRPHSEAGKEEMQALREDVVQELQQMRREVAELGERVDFTERLLAKQREAERPAALGGGGNSRLPRGVQRPHGSDTRAPDAPHAPGLGSELLAQPGHADCRTHRGVSWPALGLSHSRR